MQNTYQEKLADLEVNNSKDFKKLEGGINFKIKSDFQPSGDQPEAIKKLLKNLEENKQEQVLLGVTGSGKTFTMAKVIEKSNRPALILSGVSKSGSPAPKPITSLPAARNSLAFVVTAIVGDGFIRFKVLETMLIEIYNTFF